MGVGPCFVNIMWKLIRVHGSVYNIVNAKRQMHLDGNIHRDERVKLWVGKGGVPDQGPAPEFIQCEFIPAAGINNYFIRNVGKQKYLDSNGMGLLRDKGSHPKQITWKVI